MACSIVAGTYVTVKDAKTVEWYKKIGVPDADKLLNAKIIIKVAVIDGKDYVTQTICDELPELNSLANFTEGVEQWIESALVGGKAKVLFNKTSPTEVKGRFSSPIYGDCTWTESYSDDGYEVNWNIKGTTFKEFYKRQVCETGTYVYESGENIIEFLKAQGLRAEKFDIKDWKTCLKACENGFIIKESFGDVSATNKMPLDKEFIYKMPGMPDKKCVLTKKGCGKYHLVTKGVDSGRVEEWDVKFCDEGAVWCGKDKKSGQTCKTVAKKICDISGTYKMLWNTGFDKMGQAIGWSKELCQKVENDFDNRVIVTTLGDCIRAQQTSKITPEDMAFKLDCEFEYKIPFTGITMKAIMTMCNNKLLGVFTGHGITMMTKDTFTGDFCIYESEVVGTDIKTKMILEKVEC